MSLILELVNSYGARRMLDRTPWSGAAGTEEEGVVIVLSGQDRGRTGERTGFVADSNHHRIVVVSLAGRARARRNRFGGAGVGGWVFRDGEVPAAAGSDVGGGQVVGGGHGESRAAGGGPQRHTVLTVAGTGERAAEERRGGPRERRR